MNTGEEAAALHNKGYNCTQCVLKVCRSRYFPELDDNMLTRIASGFGGGICCGQFCGAASGGVMAVGLCHSFDETDDESIAASKAEIKKLIQSYNKDFKEKFGSLLCCDLKGGRYSCGELIAYGAELAEKMIKNKENYNGNL